MTQAHTAQPDFSRYFQLRQRVYLINISEERDRDHYESLTGIVAERSGSTVALQIPYATDVEPTAIEAGKSTFKLTTESLGGGLQIMADLVRVTEGNVFHLQLRGNMEFYQRRQTPRADIQVGMFHIRQAHSLAVYRKEFKRISNYLKTNGTPPNLKLTGTTVNLSAGGVGLSVDLKESLTPLSMFFIDFGDGAPPVCAVAELVWNRSEEGMRKCGYRFLQISKADQDRLGSQVLARQKDQGGSSSGKVNWELLDRMNFEGAARKS